MTFMKIHPIKTHKPMHRVFDEIFDRSLSDIFDADFSNNVPSANIIEEDDKFIIELATPGLSKKDISISVDTDHLIVSYEKETTDEQSEGMNYRKREFNFKSFKRSFFIPDSVNKESINAKYNNGILSISLDKKEEDIVKGPKQIDIQ